MKGRIYRTKYGWQVRFGRQICRHYPENDLKGAERYLNYLRHQTDEGIFDPRDHRKKQNPLGFKNLGRKWLVKKKKTLKPLSYANLKRYMEAAFKEWGNTNIKLIQYAEIDDFLFGLEGISEKTRSNIKSCLNSFFGWVHKREKIPAPDMPEVTFELGWRNVISIEDQQRIIDKVRDISFSINPKIWFAINCLSTYIALRPGDIISLTEKQIDTNLGAFIVPHPKEKRPKVAYLLQQDIDFIKSQPRGLPDMYFFRHPPGLKGVKAGTKFGKNYLYVYWKRACKKLGIEGVDLYGGTRHSTATALGKICTPEEVKDATGHASKAFERYFQNKQARAMKVTKKIAEFRSNQQIINLSDRKKKG